MKWLLRAIIIIALVASILFATVTEALSIDVGPGAINRDADTGTTYTVVDAGNPANATGNLTSFHIWATYDMTGVKVATFFVVTSNNLTARDWESIPGTVVAGAERIYTVNLDVVAGDYIGIWWTGGNLERTSASGTGYWYVAGDQTACVNKTFSWATPRAISIYATGATPAVAPTVITNNALSVEETDSTLSGNLTDNGGEAIDVYGYVWDTDSGFPYTSNTTTPGPLAVGEFQEVRNGLTEGELYYYRAYAHNSAGNGYGDEKLFLMKPNPVTSFNSTDNGTSWIYLGWVNGAGVDFNEVRYSAIDFPSDNVSGTLGYWGSGTTANITGLSGNTLYYFSLFSHATEGGLWSSADGTVQIQDRTDSGPLLPDNFIVTDLGAITGEFSWNKGSNAFYTMIRGSRDSYPITPAGGELLYYDIGTSVNISGFAFDSEAYYFSAWSFASDNITYSDEYATTTIGGEGMADIATAITNQGTLLSGFFTSGVSLLLALLITGLAFWQKTDWYFMLATPVDLIYGLTYASTQTVGSPAWVEGIIFAVIGTACLYKVVDSVVIKIRKRKMQT